MYVYIKSRSENLWVVGFYDPGGKWQPASDHDSENEAANRVHWLNGGNDAELEELRKRVEVLEDVNIEEAEAEAFNFVVNLYKDAQIHP